ncbi:Hydroxyisourate hydrolase [Suillus weaverae]|nr:Hydroxyisourate hydrolase [Suillus weaverae]
MSKGPITCHVLDVSLGRPAEGVEVNIQTYHKLEGQRNVDIFNPFAHGVTDVDGRCLNLLPPRGSDEARQQNKEVVAGTYKIVFKPKEYFEKTGRKCFYPWVEITFEIENPEEHYHIPLLISPYSFTTYRGS